MQTPAEECRVKSCVAMTRDRAVDIAFLVALTVAAFLLRVYNIGLPGLYQDDASGPFAVKEVIDGKMSFLALTGTVQTGPVNYYVLFPFIYMFGLTVFSIRTATISYSLVVIVMTFYLAKELFDRKVAYLAAILLAVFPTFVFISRTGLWPSFVITVFSTGTLLSLAKWSRSRQDTYFYFAALLAGFGLATKILFAWLILALVIAKFTLKIALPNRESLLRGFVAFCVGTSPLAFFYLMPIVTQHFILPNARLVSFIAQNAGTTLYGYNNLDFGANFLRRLVHMEIFLDGSFFIGVSGGTYHNYAYPMAFLLATVFLTALVALKRLPRSDRRRILLLLVILCVTLAVSIFTVTVISVWNLIILLPIPQIIVAKAAALGMSGFRSFPPPAKKMKKVMVAVGLIVLISLDVSVIGAYYSGLNRTGGVGNWSSAIYDLADYLEQNGITQPLAVDWGFRWPVAFLTSGEIMPVEVFWGLGYNTDQYWRPFFENPENVYLFHADANFERYDAFANAAKGMDKCVVVIKTFYQRNGVPVILVSKVVACSAGGKESLQAKDLLGISHYMQGFYNLAPRLKPNDDLKFGSLILSGTGKHFGHVLDRRADREEGRLLTSSSFLSIPGRKD